GISSTFVADSNRATFTFNGVTQPKGDSGAVLRALDDSFPPTPEGAAMKKAVSMCMNQRGINPFVEGCNQSAFGAMSMMGMGQVGSQYEATRGEDGSWTVRCTSLLQPQRLETPDKTTSFEPDALAAYSVTYKVGPGVDGSGNPTIAIAGSSVAYDI
ncbi:MAG TPA: hypothetical protein VLJ58_20415, partial [Ramlibacter sp.]|nr:hypothetical protein [Ramlibacter sp.]